MIGDTQLQPGEMHVPPLSTKQRGMIVRSTARVNLLEGSIRSGKTFASLVRWFTFIADDAPTRGALVMVGKSRDALYRNVFEPLENDPTLAVFQPFVHYKQGAPTAQMFGRTVHIIGAADAKAESKIRGMTVAGAYIDELTTLPKDFFKQMLGRASVPGAMIFATTNPDAPRHWLKVDYLDKIDGFPDWLVWHFTMDDNPGLTEEYKASLKREYSGLWYQRFIDGLWVAAEGAVYTMWDEDRHVINRTQLPNIDTVLGAGVDYGTTHATRGYLMGIGNDTQTGEATLYVLSEFAPATATVGQHAQMFRAWLSDQQPQSWQDPEWIAVDPAAAVFRQQLFDDGHQNVMRAHNAVLPGIQTIASLLAAGKFKVLDTCEHLIKGLPGYRWDSAASDRGLTKPIKEDDDECLALGTPVLTATGWRPVESVRLGDMVWTRGGLRPVEASAATHGGRPVETLRLNLSSGASLVVTGNHPMFLHDGSVCRADALVQDDMLYGWSNSTYGTASSSGATPDATTSHLTTPTDFAASRISTARSGSTSAATSRPAGTSITSIPTPEITSPTTSNAYPPRSTMNGTEPTSRHAAVRPNISTISAPSALSLPAGTAAPKVSPGTPSMDSAPGSTGSRNASPATSAAPSSSSTPRPGSARTPASPHGDEPTASTTRIASAHSAETASRSTGTPPHEPAQVRVLRICAGPRVTTWNLAVADDHEYVAAGVLVHNCDALRYAIYSTRRLWRDRISLTPIDDFDDEPT